MGIATWRLMQIKYVDIVLWQENTSCFSDIPKSAEKRKFAAAWQYSRKLITQERIYESLHRLFFFTHFGKGETLACAFPETSVPSCMLFPGLRMSLALISFLSKIPTYLIRLSLVISFAVTPLCKMNHCFGSTNVHNHGIVNIPSHLSFKYLVLLID